MAKENIDFGNIILNVLLTDTIKLKPTQLGKNMKDILIYHLKKKLEGICSHNGYILENSIQIYKYSIGKIIDLSLNGDILYTVMYNAKTCNPVVGNVIKCIVKNKNKFGILAVSETKHNGKTLNILEVIVPQTISDVVDVQIGKYIHVEIIGKKFELNDKKISVIGKLLLNIEKKNLKDLNKSGVKESKNNKNDKDSKNDVDYNEDDFIDVAESGNDDDSIADEDEQVIDEYDIDGVENKKKNKNKNVGGDDADEDEDVEDDDDEEDDENEDDNKDEDNKDEDNKSDIGIDDDFSEGAEDVEEDDADESGAVSD